MGQKRKYAGDCLDYSGCNFLRQRIVLATLSGKSVRIEKIRLNEAKPGLKDFEVSFLRLIEKVTDGGKIEISETGTELFYQPGLIVGGDIEHDCDPQRGVGYYLEALAALGPFGKKPLRALIRGTTNSRSDPSADAFISAAIPLLRKVAKNDDGLEGKIVKRGAEPKGGGEVFFSCPVMTELKPQQSLESGKVKKIYGFAYTMRVSQSLAHRMVTGAKGLLLKFIPDVYIKTDPYKGKGTGGSAGYGIALTAVTTNGCVYTAEAMANPDGGTETAEEIGQTAAKSLLDEIFRGGCIDSSHQTLALLYMALGQRDVSKIELGPLSQYTIQFMRHMKDFFKLMYKLEQKKVVEENQSLRVGAEKIIATCIGIGFTNINKKYI